MPISAELTPRNFITKIVNYAKVVDVPNSMTVLPTLLPLAIQAAKRGITGILNFCNPGVVSHNEVLQMYKDHIDNRYQKFVFFVLVWFLFLINHIVFTHTKKKH